MISGVETINTILSRLDDGDEWVVISALEELIALLAGAAVDSDASDGIREAMLVALPRVIELVNDHSLCDGIDETIGDQANLAHGVVAAVQAATDVETLRSLAAKLLGMLGDERGVPALISALTDDHRTTPHRAARDALRRIETKEARVALAAEPVVIGTVVSEDRYRPFVFYLRFQFLELDTFRHNPEGDELTTEEAKVVVEKIKAAVASASGDDDAGAVHVHLDLYWCSHCRRWVKLDGKGWSYGMCFSCSMDRATELRDYYDR